MQYNYTDVCYLQSLAYDLTFSSYVYVIKEWTPLSLTRGWSPSDGKLGDHKQVSRWCSDIEYTFRQNIKSIAEFWLATWSKVNPILFFVEKPLHPFQYQLVPALAYWNLIKTTTHSTILCYWSMKDETGQMTSCVMDTHRSFMQNIFYAAIFRLARNLLEARKVNLQLAIVCTSLIFSARQLSYFNPKITKKYIYIIDLYLSINTWYIFQKWTTSIFFFHGRNS